MSNEKPMSMLQAMVAGVMESKPALTPTAAERVPHPMDGPTGADFPYDFPAQEVLQTVFQLRREAANILQCADALERLTASKNPEVAPESTPTVDVAPTPQTQAVHDVEELSFDQKFAMKAAAAQAQTFVDPTPEGTIPLPACGRCMTLLVPKRGPNGPTLFCKTCREYQA